MKLETPDIVRRARRIKLLVMDCDGVLTDGRLMFLTDGDEHKSFHVHDGQGLVLFNQAGLHTAIISGRFSGALERRARELGITRVRQNVKDKVEALEEILAETAISARECAYIGDDLPDIPVMQRVELAVAVGDAIEETKVAAHYITQSGGGRGAVREVCDLILREQGRLEELVDHYRE